MPADTRPLNQLLETFRSNDGYEDDFEIFCVLVLSILAIASSLNSVNLTPAACLQQDVLQKSLSVEHEILEELSHGI